MKRRRRFAVIVLLLLLACGGVCGFGIFTVTVNLFQPAASGDAPTITFVIREGETTNEIADDLQAKGLSELSMVDATPVNRTRNLHHFFTDSPEFFDDLYRQLLQPENTVSRPLHVIRAGEGRTYWILWRD